MNLDYENNTYGFQILDMTWIQTLKSWLNLQNYIKKSAVSSCKSECSLDRSLSLSCLLWPVVPISKIFTWFCAFSKCLHSFYSVCTVWARCVWKMSSFSKDIVAMRTAWISVDILYLPLEQFITDIWDQCFSSSTSVELHHSFSSSTSWWHCALWWSSGIFASFSTVLFLKSSDSSLGSGLSSVWFTQRHHRGFSSVFSIWMLCKCHV